MSDTNTQLKGKTMKPTTNHGFSVKRHFGVMDGEKKVELILAASDDTAWPDGLIQIVNGKWSSLEPAQGTTAEQTFEASRQHVAQVGDVVDFA